MIHQLQILVGALGILIGLTLGIPLHWHDGATARHMVAAIGDR